MPSTARGEALLSCITSLSPLLVYCQVLSVGASGQASVNSKLETVEELQARRMKLHLGMLKITREGLFLCMQEKLQVVCIWAGLCPILYLGWPMSHPVFGLAYVPF